jgi:pyrroline-5-carboxylate reductase
MKTVSLGFIGGGRVTRIILQALRNKNAIFSNITVADISEDVSSNLKKLYPGIQIENAMEAASREIVFISLHPPVIMETLEQLKNQFKSDSVVISLAPKITISKIKSKLIQVANVARLIPNATSFINEGYNPVCFSPDFNTTEKEHVLDMLRILGNTFEVAEEKLESYAILSAMLPTYFWFQWMELQSIGLQMGLSAGECNESIHETISAAMNLLFRSGLTPAQVMDLIPVKPIGEAEPQITGIYSTKLSALYEKIKP